MSYKFNRKTIKKNKLDPKIKCKTEIVKIPVKPKSETDEMGACSDTNNGKQFVCVLCQNTFNLHSQLISHFR